MKRSFINQRIAHARQFFAQHHFRLPPFAAWTPGQWQQAGPEADEIRRCLLGWDLTDFGSGDFFKEGLLLFTLRNGRLHDPAYPKPYGEKIMIVCEGQVTPFHFHFDKTEDIINRGAGRLVCLLHNATPDQKLADTPVEVRCDGVLRRLPAGSQVILEPGQSITLTPYLYHTFFAQPGAGVALVGEVSSVNNDATDNRFLDRQPRFPTIEEDEPAQTLLCNEYPPAA